MDPYTVFSIACGVIQVIDFSTKVAKTCRELYKNGGSSENKDVEGMAERLTNLRKDLNLTARDDEDDLLGLGLKCSDTAQELVAELQKLKVSGPHRGRQAVSKTFRTIWKKSTIDGIQKRLKDYRKLLNSRILIDLRQRWDLLALQQSEGFQDLDQKVQTIISKLAQGPQNFDELKTLIQTENDSLKGYVTDEFLQHRTDLAHKNYCQQFLESLWYPEINRRKETVGEAHQKTFQWIYEPHSPNTPTCRWDNFVQWLENDRGLYWINGKAGSGKSTLMSYVYQDARTSKSLKVWSKSKEVFTPSFFFWGAGSTLEKSSEGFLRSLLYQILQKLPSLIPSSREDQYVLDPGKNDPQVFDPIAAWTLRRLQTLFQTVICQAQGICRICIFIDGLDEISGDPDTTIAMIKGIQSTDVKVCLSSRPDRMYIDAFDSSAKLRLQDLTESDIRTYVRDKLQPFLGFGCTNIVGMLDKIVLKAQGVFLWVELVVKTLIKGLKNDDSLTQLQARVEATPSDLEALYVKMLDSIEGTYRAEAAQLFQMVLANLNPSLLDVAIALDNKFDCVSGMSIRDALGSCRRAQKRIPTVSAALLEIHDIGFEDFARSGRVHVLPVGYSRPETSDIAKYERHTRVDFIHRTDDEFLRQSKQGRRFLEIYSPLCPSPRSTYVRALLTKMTLLRFLEKPENMETAFESSYSDYIILDPCDHSVDVFAGNYVDKVMQNVYQDECDTGSAQISLCEDVDRTLAAVHQRYQPAPTKVHWSTRWGSRLSEFRELTYGLEFAGSVSRSSSSDSYHSTRSNVGFSFNRPVDFLGQAASWTLSGYVIKVFDMQQEHLDKGYVDYLLCCSILALFHIQPRYQSHEDLLKLLNLVTELLSRGGNPNFYVENFSTTVWGLFVKSNSCNFLSDHIAFATTMKMFLQRGADVHVRIPGHAYVSKNLLKHNWIHSICVRYEWSALRTIRLWLDKAPEWRNLEAMILTKGARYFFQCTHIGLSVEDYKLHRISEKQHDKVITALDLSYSDSGEGYRMLPLPVMTRWTSELEQIYQEMSERIGHSDVSETSEEDATFDIE